MGIRIKERQIRIGGRIYTIPRKMMICAVTAAICICAAAGTAINYRANKAPGAALLPVYSPVPAVQTEPAPAPAGSPAAEILLHVAGAVKDPGLIRIRAGARIADAVAAAGGFTEAADGGELNLAAPVYDGMKLYVPRTGETPAMLPPATPVPSGSGQPAKININTAGIAELTALDGIGEATAKKILTYREERGKFQKTEDLLQVNGIGNAKYEAIKDRICV